MSLTDTHAATLMPPMVNGLVGVVAGALVLAVVTGVGRLRGGKKAAH